jgi:putative DNA primase/helicase
MVQTATRCPPPQLESVRGVNTGFTLTAEDVAKALRARKVGGGWIACCPAHHDREPSLSIREADDGKILVHCHAGCDQKPVIAALRSRGLWPENGPQRSNRSTVRATSTNQPGRDDAKRTEAALAIWNAAVSAEGSLVETYLAARNLHLASPETLRFHSGLNHRSGGIWPAMVALVTRGIDDTPLAIHRTFLAHDGSGKAPIDPQKMMLGPCRGAAVRLAPAGDALMLGEGIETCLAAMQATGHPTWAALSASGLLALDLPPHVRDVIVLADGDEAGKAAACGAALRWKREGRRVRIAHAPDGRDFNDMLVGWASNKKEGA